MRIMISYTREDVEAVERMVERLRRLGHETWYDRGLHAGEDWWKTILQNIERSDAVLLALSPAFAESIACKGEWSYTLATKRPLLAIMIAPVRLGILPEELANLHILDYTQPSEEAAFELVRSIGSIRPAPPLPNPLPPQPPTPLSFLNSIRSRIGEPMGRKEQDDIVEQLSQAMQSRDSEEQLSAEEIARMMLDGDELYDKPAQRLREALRRDPGEPLNVIDGKPIAPPGPPSKPKGVAWRWPWRRAGKKSGKTTHPVDGPVEPKSATSQPKFFRRRPVLGMMLVLLVLVAASVAVSAVVMAGSY